MTGRHRAPQRRPYRIAASIAAGGLLAAVHLDHAQAATPEPVVAPAVPVKAAVLTQPAPTPKPAVRTVMAAAKVKPHRTAPLTVTGQQGLTSNAVALLAYIDANYPEVTRVGGVRPDRIPDHPTGHALDVMVGANRALGDRICADILAQFDRFHMRYLIWRETYRRPGVARWMADRGSVTANHGDHLHLAVA